MARLTRETARRSINSLLDKLPRDAAVELTRTGQVPQAGAAVIVKIEITDHPDELETRAAPKSKEKRHEDI